MKKINISETLWDKINEAEKLGFGSFSIVHQSKDGKNVIKHPNERNRYMLHPDNNIVPNEYTDKELNQFKFMAAYPEVFVKIKKIHSRYLITEKLDTKTAHDKWVSADKELHDNHCNYLSDYKDLILDGETIPKTIQDKIKQMSEQTQDFLKELSTLLIRFRNLDYKNVLLLNYADIHGQNIGYDNEGKLKIFDF